MPAVPPLESPFEAFAKCGDRLLLIGGNAMIGYGSERLTQDCDCAVVVEDEQLLAETLLPYGYFFKERFSSFSRYTHLGNRRPVVDVMLLNRETFDKLWATSREVRMVGHRLRIPKPLHLVALKLHALKQDPKRAWKDLEDICFLLERDRSDWTREELSDLAGRYASDDVCGILRERGFI